MEELAREAGITVRTLRFYRERKLIPPPRREGRIAWYDDGPPGPAAHDRRAPGTRPHPQRHRGTRRGLRPRPRRRRTPRRRRAHRGGPGPPHPGGTGRPSSRARTPRRTSPPPWTSATSAPTATRSSTSAAACWTLLGPGPRGHPPRGRSSPRPTGSANTPTPWPSCSPTWSSQPERPTAPRRTSNACARWPGAWWRRSCRLALDRRLRAAVLEVVDHGHRRVVRPPLVVRGRPLHEPLDGLGRETGRGDLVVDPPT